MTAESRPPPRTCLHCASEALMEPVSALLPLSGGAFKKAWRYHCTACSATRYEPARERDLPGWCDRRGGPTIV